MATKLATKTFGQVITALLPGVFKTLSKVNPSGSLQARKQAVGTVSFFWRYSIGTTSQRVPVGIYDPTAAPKSLTATPRGLSVAAAIHAAEKLALEHF